MTTRTINAVGVLVDPHLKQWQVDALERLLELDDIDIELVVINDVERERSETVFAANDGTVSLSTLRLGLDVLQRQRAWTFVLAERELARRLGDELPLRSRRPVERVSCLDHAEMHRVKPVTDGVWSEIPSETVDEIEATCDIAVRFGFGLIRGDVLTAPRHGVLSFHPADICRYRGLGLPSAFHDGCRVIRPTLQRLSDLIDGGEIIAKGHVDVPNCATLWDVYEEVFAHQAELLSEGIEALRTPGFDPKPPRMLGEYYSMSRRFEPKFAARILSRNLEGRFCQAFR